MAEAKDMEGISQLPEPIIQHILSFLTTKEAAKTCVLSKSWLNAWRTRPTLELSNTLFFAKLAKEKNILYWYDSEEGMRRCNEFTTYVKQALKRYREQNIVVDTFKLELGNLFHDGKSIVEKCTKLALKFGVRNLDVKIRPFRRCELPQIVLEAESLEGLNIALCNLSQQPTEEIRCHRLKRLQLSSVSLDEVMLEKVISRCPLIEFLQISGCIGFKNIKVTQVRNLKRFVVDICMDQRIEVEAPNLELLSCSNKPYCSADKRVPSWLTLHAPQYQNLKNLVLCGGGIYDHFFINLADKFPHLEDISIDNCLDLQRIKLSSPSLKIIRLKKNLELKEAQFDVPNLVRFEYECQNLKPVLSFTSASDHWISDICIIHRNNLDASWFLRLMEFLENLIESEISIRINFLNYIAVPFVIDEIRSNVMLNIDEINSTVVEVQQLSLYFYGNKFPASSVDTVLDVIFLICHPKTIVQYWPKNLEENKFVKSLYEMIMIKKNQEPVWQHYLNEAEVKAIQNGTKRAASRNHGLEKSFEYVRE